MKNGLKIYQSEVFKKKICHSIQIQKKKQEKNLKEVQQKKKDLPLNLFTTSFNHGKFKLFP